MLRTAALAAFLVAAPAAFAADGTVSVEEGARIAIIGGCHDCHTAGYAESAGQIDPAKALAGNPVGFEGPWGTTFAANLRLTAAGFETQEAWVEFLHGLEARPPMPWFNLHAFHDYELASLYLYIKSLGEPGPAAPDYIPPQ